MGEGGRLAGVRAVCTVPPSSPLSLRSRRLWVLLPASAEYSQLHRRPRLARRTRASWPVPSTSSRTSGAFPLSL